ncbi:uncharacterized protein LOC110691634 [Chenopodium quinoa]|uniref:uncharacterized protein LOC110691634 n=1 Tax=Chenopodium quinoa TaxID=63459 RepID=UPI000B76D4FD|nr:uncharacterized protein LOC110691634 [Chenopodium quinoa]
MGKDDDTSSSSSYDYHLDLGVNNIKNVIPLILDREKVQYSNWVELFECYAHAYNILDHIDSKTPKLTDISDERLKRLDSIVKNWIYGTISKDFLETIIEKGAAAQQIWDKLKNLKDQLANVDQPVLEQKLVIRLVSGLINTDVDIVAAMIQQM